MNTLHFRRALFVAASAVLLACMPLPASAAEAKVSKTGKRARVERKFPLLEIETRLYTNATVTPGLKDIFISHSGGLETIKVNDLSDELKEELGYSVPKPSTNSVATWTKSQVSKIQVQDLKTVEQSVRDRVPLRTAKGEINLPVAITMGGIVLILFVFFSYCCKQICDKSGTPASGLVWIPILQLVPMFRAAGMQPVWALFSLVPVLNIIAWVLWCFKIAAIRKKGVGLAIALLLPVTSPFAFLYLAFGEGAPPPAPVKERRPELMTLEAA